LSNEKSVNCKGKSPKKCKPVIIAVSPCYSQQESL
jgi:hypothetical protein